MVAANKRNCHERCGRTTTREDRICGFFWKSLNTSAFYRLLFDYPCMAAGVRSTFKARAELD